MVELGVLDAELRPGGDCHGAALKISLAELQHSSINPEGRILCTRHKLCVQRVWVQGNVVCRDGDDVVDLDDGTAVVSLDVGDLVESTKVSLPEVAESLHVGSYISCVCVLEALEDDILNIRAESVCAIDGPMEAVAKSYWQLEVAEAMGLREHRQSAAPRFLVVDVKNI